jgi:hypothetical protein
MKKVRNVGYGVSTPQSASETDVEYQAMVDGNPITLIVRFYPGRDAHLRAGTVEAELPHGSSIPWDESAMRALVASALPSDANVQSTQQASAGTVTLYFSAAEATAFPSDDFQAAGGNTPQPGVIGVICQAPSDALFGYCVAAITAEA